MKYIKRHKEFINEEIDINDDDIQFTNGNIPKGAVRIPLSELFKHEVEKPYVGLVIKLQSGLWGVIIDVFERNGDYLFDIYVQGDEEVDKNRSWNRDCKTVFGDIKYGWGAFGDRGVPNIRHEEEIAPLILRVMDKFGFEPQTRDNIQ